MNIVLLAVSGIGLLSGVIDGTVLKQAQYHQLLLDNNSDKEVLDAYQTFLDAGVTMVLPAAFLEAVGVDPKSNVRQLGDVELNIDLLKMDVIVRCTIAACKIMKRSKLLSADVHKTIEKFLRDWFYNRPEFHRRMAFLQE